MAFYIFDALWKFAIQMEYDKYYFTAAINAGCFIFSTHAAVVIAIIAAVLCFIVGPILDKL